MANRWVVLFGVCSLYGCKGGSGPAVDHGSESDRNGSGGSVATRPPPPPPPAPPPRFTCADLQGARRSNLQPAPDGKIVYYIQQVRGPDGDDASETPSYDLHAFDLARRSAKLVLPGVSQDAVLAADGTVVFSRATNKPDRFGEPRRMIMVAPPGKEPVAATSELDGLRRFAIDPDTSTIVYEYRNDIREELWKVALAGGKPEKISSSLHYWMLDVAEKSVLTSNSHRLARQPIAGGRMVDFADVDANYYEGVFRGQVVLLGKKDRTLSLVQIAAGAKPTALALGAEVVRVTRSGDQVHAIVKNKDAYEVRALADPTARSLLVIHGVLPTDISLVGGQLVMLAIVDTNHDGDFDGRDESDLCFAAPGPDPIDVPARRVPKQFVGIAAQLETLARTGALAGARLRFVADRTIEFAIPAAPPDATDNLLALVKQTQNQVTQLSKGIAGPPLSVMVRADDTGQCAVSEWDAGVGEFLVTSGIGTAQLADRTQYAIEGDPKVTYARSEFIDALDDATCSGTIKNISGRELSDLEVACAEHALDDRHPARVKLRPSKLAPGATGSYRLTLGYAGVWSRLGLSVFSGGKRLAYFNTYGAKRNAQIIAAAMKIHAATRLAYWTAISRPAPSFLTKLHNIYVHAPKDLEQGPPADLQRAAAKALSLFVAGVPSNPRLEGNPQLLILRAETTHVGWTYANGKLTASSPETH